MGKALIGATREIGEAPTGTPNRRSKVIASSADVPFGARNPLMMISGDQREPGRITFDPQGRMIPRQNTLDHTPVKGAAIGVFGQYDDAIAGVRAPDDEVADTGIETPLPAVPGRPEFDPPSCTPGEPAVDDDLGVPTSRLR